MEDLKNNIDAISLERYILLSKYLAYGLVVQYKEFRYEVDSLGLEWIFIANENGLATRYGDVRPVFRPNSDIVKEIEINGNRLIPIVELAKLFHTTKGNDISHYTNIKIDDRKRYSVNCCVDNDDSRYMYFQINFDILSESYQLVDKLIEWGFDVFDQIGLYAVSYNSKIIDNE